MRVAIQGIAGCFSAAAARRLAPAAELEYCRSFEDLFASLGASAQAAVVPVENSLVGPIVPVQGQLAASGAGRQAELWLPIEQCLILPPGSALPNIRHVLSHPVALAQCRRYLALHSAWRTVPFFDTAGSVREIMRNHRAGCAAIAGVAAAETYGAVVVERGIEDRQDNQTLFWLIAAPG